MFRYGVSVHDQRSLATVGKELMPGYKYTLLVTPSKVEADKNLEDIEIEGRKCLMPSEKNILTVSSINNLIQYYY